MTLTQFVLVTLLAILGATTQGSLGSGYGLVAGAGLVAIDPAFVPGPVLVVGMVVAFRHLLVERKEIERLAWARCTMGLPIGLIAGLAIVSAMSDRTLSLLIGAAIILAAVVLLSGVHIRRTPLVEVISGAASAFGAITASIPGPPFVIAFSDLRPGALRATSTAFLIVLTLISWAGLSFTGNFGRAEYDLVAALLPGTIVGLFASRYVRPHLDRPWFRPLILVMAAAGGIGLVLRNL